MYGGDFNWGSETFTLWEPKAGETHRCSIAVSFGTCNGGSGNNYLGKIWIKYDANNPNSQWEYVTGFYQARGCQLHVHGRRQSSQYTQVKVEWYDGGVLKDSAISGMFRYIWDPRCPQIEEPNPEFIQISGCKCKSIDSVLPRIFEKMEVFDITGRRIFFTDKTNREFFADALNDLPEGIYFLRIITKEKIYIRKIASTGEKIYLK